MRPAQANAIRTAIGGALVAAALATGGLLALPVAAIVGGVLLVALGAALAYDLRGLGARWIAWKRGLGGPAFRVSVWIDRTLDGAAVAWLGVAVAWVGIGSLV
jgi:hypothetical protein